MPNTVFRFSVICYVDTFLVFIVGNWSHPFKKRVGALLQINPLRMWAKCGRVYLCVHRDKDSGCIRFKEVRTWFTIFQKTSLIHPGWNIGTYGGDRISQVLSQSHLNLDMFQKMALIIVITFSSVPTLVSINLISCFQTNESLMKTKANICLKIRCTSQEHCIRYKQSHLLLFSTNHVS